MPYQIQLYVDKEYEKKKNSFFYSLYYEFKSMFINHITDYKYICIQTCNTEEETIYETFQYLVKNNYGGLSFDEFLLDVHNDLYDSTEKTFIEQLYLYYYNNDKNLDLKLYTMLKFIEFLTYQTPTIHDIHKTCLKYCDDSYTSEWCLEFECTE